MRMSGRVESLRTMVGNKKLENVDQSTYLGSLVTKHGYCAKEIRSSIAMAKVILLRRNHFRQAIVESGTEEETNKTIHLERCFRWLKNMKVANKLKR